MSGKRTLMDRVEVGAYYTDGADLWRVEKLCALGLVELKNADTNADREIGIDAFRRKMWLVKTP